MYVKKLIKIEKLQNVMPLSVLDKVSAKDIYRRKVEVEPAWHVVVEGILAGWVLSVDRMAFETADRQT